MKKIFSGGFFSILFLLLLMFSAQAAEPIKVGVLTSLSGVGEIYGIPGVAGAQIAVDEINKAGGVLGRPLQVVPRDDKLDPEAGIRGAKDLILSEKVTWIQGTVSSAVALAVSAYSKSQKVIFIVTSAQSAEITEKRDIATFLGSALIVLVTDVLSPMLLTSIGRVARMSLFSVLTTNMDTDARRISWSSILSWFPVLGLLTSFGRSLVTKLGHLILLSSWHQKLTLFIAS